MADNNDVYLYILARNDLASLNPGKLSAQVGHSANQCISECKDSDLRFEWEKQTGKGFGTCIVLAVDYTQLKMKIKMAKLLKHHANITHDPSYPLMDGKTLHLIPLDTCGYIFARKNDVREIVGDLDLYP